MLLVEEGIVVGERVLILARTVAIRVLSEWRIPPISIGQHNLGQL